MYPLAAAYPESVTIPITRAVEMIGALKMHQLGFRGQGVKVAVLDTGVSQDHVMIKPNIIHAEAWLRVKVRRTPIATVAGVPLR